MLLLLQQQFDLLRLRFDAPFESEFPLVFSPSLVSRPLFPHSSVRPLVKQTRKLLELHTPSELRAAAAAAVERERKRGPVPSSQSIRASPSAVQCSAVQCVCVCLYWVKPDLSVSPSSSSSSSFYTHTHTHSSLLISFMASSFASKLRVMAPDGFFFFVFPFFPSLLPSILQCFFLSFLFQLGGETLTTTRLQVLFFYFALFYSNFFLL